MVFCAELKVLKEKYNSVGKIAEFIDFQADVDTTDSEFEKKVNDDRDEVTSLIDDLFVDDNNTLFYYHLESVSKTADETINDFLINDNETVSDEISNYCQESSSGDEDKIENFAYSKNKIDPFKNALFSVKDAAGDSLFYAICYALRQQKTTTTKDSCSDSDLQNEINLNL